MPGVVDSNGQTKKRKRVDGKTKPLKRLRPGDSEDDIQSQILSLENEILESKKNYNHLSTLLNIVQDFENDPDNSLLAAVSLCRVFTRLTTSDSMRKSKTTSEKDAIVIAWLRERYNEYKQLLLSSLVHESSASTVLTLLMRTLRTEAAHSETQQDYVFPVKFLKEIVHTLLQLEDAADICHEFGQKYLEEHDDLRYYGFEAFAQLFTQEDIQIHTTFIDNAIIILSAVETVPEGIDEIEDFYVPKPLKPTHPMYAVSSHKKQAQAAWLAVMRTQMNKEQKKAILKIVSSIVAPWFIKPELLMDFLTDCYDTGGSISLLALSGVFYLIQERNLDYPSFYRKLYSLLDSDILHSKHRSKFFRLLDTFMASTHLPAVLVASFIKRLSRLTLFAPPAGIVAVIPWIYNLLKRHPTCTFMIHREIIGKDAKEILEQEGMADPFKTDEADPMNTNAIESSLWELIMLQSHYHPNVATLAKIISEQFTKQSYNLEDFLDHSYGSLLEAELSKEVKKVPVIEFEIPKKIFMKQAADSGIADGLLVKLWSFSYS